jgi:small subunit ribosomal protein S6
MTLPAPTYDLVLLLDPEAEDAARTKLVADARASIEAQGEFLRHDEWGSRALTYPIDRKAVAEYHLLQFHAGTPELLRGLDRSLRIADGILRFRIVKLKPGVADAPDMRTTATPTPSTATTPPADAAPEPGPADNLGPGAEPGPAADAAGEPAGETASAPVAANAAARPAESAAEPPAESTASPTAGDPADAADETA